MKTLSTAIVFSLSLGLFNAAYAHSQARSEAGLGRVPVGAALVGTVLRVEDAEGGPLPVRLDSIEPDPQDPHREVLLYTFSTPDPTTEWAIFRNRNPLTSVY